MKFRLNSLNLVLKREEVTIPFSEVSYFWGQMGAGKTSIARLIDYCLGGDIELSPALQSEFVSATLNMSLERSDLIIERPRESDRVIARWGTEEDPFQVSVPTRTAAGEVVPGSGVEVLSDLIFWLSGITAPRVRKSKLRQETDLARLSIRDLLWYCYLDQDSMDSSFFHLDEDANHWKRLKSRDVLRYVIGFHDEKVADLEAQLDQLRGERSALAATLASTVRILKEVGVESESEINARVEALRERAASIQKEIEKARTKGGTKFTTHTLDELRPEARRLGDELGRISEAMDDLRKALDKDRRHLNEIETLSLKFRRSVSAKAVLSGVAFKLCPRCAQALPEREAGSCGVCGQPDHIIAPDPTEESLIDRDVKLRAAELREFIKRHEESLNSLARERESLLARKERVEHERNEASKHFDSAYLSTILTKEREQAALVQQADSLASLRKLSTMVEEQRKSIAKIEARESSLRDELQAARSAAENDATNLKHLKGFYLDCLVRAGIPGISQDDEVEIPTPSFFPHIKGTGENEEQITSFATISSGGKKNLFKSCFAIAVHRLAASENAPLPELLVIDSAMKNISERENREQFEGFYRMLYELKTGELASTQMILIDKEFSAPDVEYELEITSRLMRPNDPDNPPLITHYQGK